MTVAGISLLGFAMDWNVIFYSSPTVIGIDLDRVGVHASLWAVDLGCGAQFW